MSSELEATLNIIEFSDIFGITFFRWTLDLVMPEVNTAIERKSSITSKNKFSDESKARNHAIRFAEKYNIKIS